MEVELSEINNYINTKLCDCDNDLSVIMELLKLDHYLKNNFSFLDNSVLISILNNNKIKKYLNLLINKEVTRSTIKCITSNKIITNMIELYCIENDIAIVENIKRSYNNGYSDDLMTSYIREAKERRCEISSNEEKYLAIRIQNNDKKALNFLVESNLLLVISRIHFYHGLGVDDLDLIQEGNKSLIRAAELFDYQKGCRFSTYAIWAINRSLRRLIQKFGKSISVTCRTQDKLFKLEKATYELEQLLERKPSYEELAAYTHFLPETIERILKSKMEIISYNQEVKDDKENNELINFLTDGIDYSSEEAISNICYEQLVKGLNPKEIELLILHHGTQTTPNLSFGEIAKIFNCSKQGVHQREKRVLEKIRMKNIGFHNY